jgi:hypothetical protein
MCFICRSLFLLISMVIVWEPAWSQRSDGWKNYTAQNSIQSISVKDGSIWAATTGGVFCYHIADSSFLQFTNSEGLPSNDVTSIAVDDNGGVWTGDASGGLAYFDPSAARWSTSRDITNSSFVNKRINALLHHGDSLFVAADYGVSLFYKQAFEFRDSYIRFGNFAAQKKVNGMVILGDDIWIATVSGVAVASMSASNLISPSAWQTYTTAQGLPSDSVQTIFTIGGMVYAGTNRGIAYYNNTAWVGMDAFGVVPVCRSFTGTEGTYIVTATALFLIQSPTQFQKISDFTANTITDIYAENGKIIVGTSEQGLGFFEETGIRYKVPNSPASNLFISLGIDQTGTLWAASGRDGRGHGFYSFDGTTWKNFSRSTDTLIKSDDYHRIGIGVNNTKWIGAWGDGMMMVRDDNSLYRYHSQNSPFLGIKEDPKFIVICDVATDWRGNTWFLDWNPADNKPLWVLHPDSTWEGFLNGYDASYSMLSGMTIDQNGNKWLYQRLPTVLMPGLFFVDSRGTLDDPSDDTWRLLTTSSGLVSNSITAVTVDNEGSIWVGTTSGANVILNPLSPESSLDRSIVIPLAGIQVNAIAVDPLNNKWVGTKEGVFVLSDRATVVASYTVSSTGGKLPDNDVRAIAFDGNRGIVYLGTEKGLASITTPFIAPHASFQDITVYPNPFIVSVGKTLTIDGLVQNASVKILSNDGRLVRELMDKNSLPGGRIAFWDGTNQEGTPVASGIYLIVIYSQQGDQVTMGKVAVVRR